MTHTHTISRAGMAPVPAELIFACPGYYVLVRSDGREITIPARDGTPLGCVIVRHDTEGSSK